MTLFPRSSGVLLHPTSLPGRYGIGDLGEYAYQFVDWLEITGQTIWQILPLGPTSYGDSPYQCLSAFAGNTNLISLDTLVGEGWLTNADLADVPDFPVEYVDFGPVIEYHNQKLNLAFERFDVNGTDEQRKALAAWSKTNNSWLDDWTLFIACKNENNGRPWVEWQTDLALYQPDALKAARERLKKQIEKHCFLQWVFYTQWAKLKGYANDRGIRLIGDIPIFVAHDSSDVWAYKEGFYLDEKGHPELIAGVPPDYFSVTGQRWGNPLYRWEVMEARKYSWWINRFKTILEQVDLVRIDHFRGFEAYWEIPASEETAINGTWVKGPNDKFFQVLEKSLGKLPIIAEDLGVITEEVATLRDSLGLPGMKVLQFAWSDPSNFFLPHNHIENCVVYSGTHDNNTTNGWWATEVNEETRQFIKEYLDLQGEIDDPSWIMIRLGMRSSAHTFIMPMQDIMRLGAEARMNTPGKESGNWGWRFTEDVFKHEDIRHQLGRATWLYQRRADQQEKVYGDPATR